MRDTCESIDQVEVDHHDEANVGAESPLRRAEVVPRFLSNFSEPKGARKARLLLAPAEIAGWTVVSVLTQVLSLEMFAADVLLRFWAG